MVLCKIVVTDDIFTERTAEKQQTYFSDVAKNKMGECVFKSKKRFVEESSSLYHNLLHSRIMFAFIYVLRKLNNLGKMELDYFKIIVNNSKIKFAFPFIR